MQKLTLFNSATNNTETNAVAMTFLNRLTLKARSKSPEKSGENDSLSKVLTVIDENEAS
jgi:hypothetical protein